MRLGKPKRGPCFLLLVVQVILSGSIGLFAGRQSKNRGNGFPFDLDSNYEEVVAVVREEVAAGIIHGTWEYANEQQLSGAISGKANDPFPSWSVPGDVFYLQHPDTLAPAHFKDSSDMGTVIVRYLVQPLHPGATHIEINAVFLENAGHHRHPSDGTVEASEFTEIVNRIKAEAAQRLETAKQQEAAAEENKLSELHRALEAADAAVREEAEAVHQLSLRADQLRAQAQMQVRVQFVLLRAQPFATAKQVEALQEREVVTVLQRTPFWYHVRTARQTQGWLHYLSLGPVSLGDGSNHL